MAPEDPEPEYVTINQRNQVAVTLQENNGIAIIDLPTSKVLRAFTAGTVDLTGIDTVEDGRIDLTGSQADVAAGAGRHRLDRQRPAGHGQRG